MSNTQIDELVKNARSMAMAMDKTFSDSNAANTWRAVANALEAQAARESLLREDLQHMESLAEEYLASSNAQAARVKELEASLTNIRDAAKQWCDAVDRESSWDGWDHHFKAMKWELLPQIDSVLMSARRNTETKDGP